MTARNGEPIYFLIQVLEKGAHMNQNYPEYIMKKLREWDDLDVNDKSRDDELQELSPEEAFDRVLSYEGIFGYRASILGWIEDIFKVKLMPFSGYQSRQDFVQGLGNIFAVQDEMGGVSAMRMDENDQVTIFFKGGGTHHANCAMDSKRTIIYDILKQGF